ncbi:MAG: HEPN domain-containing protein [Pseudomonadota bacterium]|nr:HEPN domain-containing protein [Pseudomonadota bacterium]
MTQNELARAYLNKARNRVRVLEVLMEQDAWSDVVREAQELVELALKGVLRQLGIDPPKWHDVGPVLVEHQEKLPKSVRNQVDRLADISRWLRKEREFSFYGDTDFIPTEQYTHSDASRAFDDAVFVLSHAETVIDSK